MITSPNVSSTFGYVHSMHPSSFGRYQKSCQFKADHHHHRNSIISQTKEQIKRKTDNTCSTWRLLLRYDETSQLRASIQVLLNPSSKKCSARPCLVGSARNSRTDERDEPILRRKIHADNLAEKEAKRNH